MKNKLRILIYCLTMMVVILAFQTPSVAVTAYPKPIEFTQPDGSKITIRLKGDEKVHWAETMDGYTLLFNQQGFYEYAVIDNDGNLAPSGVRANNISGRKPNEQAYVFNLKKGLYYSKKQISTMLQVWDFYGNQAKIGGFPTLGTRKLLLILGNFNNTTPTFTRLMFDNMMNQFNYNGTGSFKDYWAEASYNQLIINTTVVGWVTVPNAHDYYSTSSSSTTLWREFVYNAIQAADPLVNYSQFDNDGDGDVDGVAVIHQGPGQEETANVNDIWSHSSTLSVQYTAGQRTFDGVTVNDYTTQPELTASGEMAGIGTICHEIGHNLGAYDFYDVDYETNGQFDGTGYWDLQASGSYNGNGHLPAHPNPWTKINVYNWATATDLGTTPRDVTVYNSTLNKGSFYRFNTATANEYYLIENRQQIGFDSDVPGHGLLIYHVASTMSTVQANVNNSHPNKMFPLAASLTINMPTGAGTYGIIDGAGCTWPGTSGKTSFTDASVPWARSWASANSSKPITNITEISSNKTVVFRYMGGPACTMPTTQAVGFSATNITTTSMTLSWVRGNGNNCLVVARAGGEVNADPVNGTGYTANAAFGSGNQIGTGNYVIFNGAGTSVNLTGLSANTTYYFSIYEYNTTGTCYMIPGNTGYVSTSHVATPPVASFTANKTSISVGSEIEFTETATNYPTSYQWTFEGGIPSTSTSRTPVITWVDGGSFDVSLTVSNADGSDVETITNYITVNAFTPPSPNPKTIGSGTAISGYPLGMAVRWGQSASIYLSTEIGGSGYIDQLAWYTQTARGARNITIKMAHTAATTLTAATWASVTAGSTQVFSGSISNTANQWKTIDLTTPFLYNGTDNLLIMVSVDVNTQGQSSDCRYSTVATNRHQGWTGTVAAPSTGNGTVSTSLPNIQIRFQTATAPTANFAGLSAPFFTETFDNATFPPTGWTTNPVDGGGNVWTTSTAQNHNSGGTRSAVHNFHATQAENDYLISPQILALPANSALSFWSYNAYPTWYAKNSVLISTTTNAPASFTEIWSPTSVSESWVGTTLDLSSYAGQDIYIAFRYEGTDAHNWFVDDVSISNYNYTQITAYEGDVVNIYDKSTGNPIVWDWTLTGGSPIQTPNQDAATTYATAGLYNVSLKVGNIGGSNTKSVSNFVNITGRAPIANCEFLGNLKTGTFQAFSPAGGSVQFNDLSTRAPSSWAWTTTGGFPASSTLQNPSIAYNTAGTYSSSVKVSNAYGTDTKSNSNNIKIGGTSEITNLIPGDVIRSYKMIANPLLRLPGHCYVDLSGTNYYFYEYLDFYSNEYPGQITKLRFNPDTAAGTAGKNVIFKVYDGRDGDPSTLLGSKTVAINTLTSDVDNTITFDTPINVSGDFYIGYQVFYDGLTTAHNYNTHNFCTRMAQNRVGDNVKYTTLYGKIGTTATPDATSFWYPVGSIFGIESSLAIWPEFSYVVPTTVSADFTASKTELNPGGSTNFLDISTGTPTSWLWTFSGGTPATSTVQNPTVTYATAGSYFVSLKVSNGSSTNTKLASGYINVSAPVTNPGDVNGDGLKNVLDLVWLISYVNGSTPGGFVLANADVNLDASVNVADVAALINLILGGAKTNVALTSDIAHLYLEQDGTISFESDGTLIAMQFELKGQQLHQSDFNQLLANDYQLAFNEQTGKGIIYSMSNVIFPQGRVNILKLNSNNIDNIIWGIAEAANTSFNTVPVVTHKQSDVTNVFEIVNNKDFVQIMPNPNHGSFVIKVNLSKKQFIQLELLDEKGRLINRTDKREVALGEQNINCTNKDLSTGIYIVRISSFDENGNLTGILHEEKVMIVK